MKAIKVTVLIIQLLLPTLLTAQTGPLDWVEDDRRIILFQISQDEVKELLYKKDRNRYGQVKKYLHTLIGVYKKEEARSLPEPGHYLVCELSPNGEYYHHTQKVPFRVNHFSEYGFLTLQVIDTAGNISSRANIRVKNPHKPEFSKEFAYDPVTFTYRLAEKEIPENTLLFIEQDGFEAWYNIEIQIPYIRGSYNSAKESLPSFYSYMVTDKNQYRPGETIRFKSYSLSPNKEPLTEPLDLWINISYNKEKKIATINPYRPGGYHGEFVLTDSLELLLDQSYRLSLKTTTGERICHQYFNYKDYELQRVTTKATQALRSHYSHETNYIEVEATDANGLAMPGATATMVILPEQIQKAFTPVYLLPDTFLQTTVSLFPSGQTKIEIPNTIFGQVNLSYQIQIEIQTPDYYQKSYTFQSEHLYSHHSIRMKNRGKDQQIEYIQEGISVPMEAILFTTNDEEGTPVKLPYTLPVNPEESSYRVFVPSTGLTQTFDLFDQVELPRIEGHFSPGGLYVKTSNPARLDMTWFVYCGETLLYKGIEKEIHDSFPVPEPNTVCYVEGSFHIGGKEKQVRHSIIPKSRYLHITNDLPERIYPGQQIETTLTVHDESGLPAGGVDLTAFATNAMLNYHPADLPSHEPAPRYRKRKPQAKPDNHPASWQKTILRLDYSTIDMDFWRETIGLDSLEIFNFCCPGKELYTYTLDTPDGTTQFAPFLIYMGSVYPVDLIECDGEPLWFSWTNYPDRYSVPIAPDKPHTITLRQATNRIVLEDIRFEPGKKTILTLDLMQSPLVPPVRGHHPTPYGYGEFTPEEKEKYNAVVSAFHYLGDPAGYGQKIEFGNESFRLSKGNLRNWHRREYEGWIGPITPVKATTNEIPFLLEGGKSYRITKDSIRTENDYAGLQWKYINDGFPHNRINWGRELKNKMNEFFYPAPPQEETAGSDKAPWTYQTIHLSLPTVSDQPNIEISLPDLADNPGVARTILIRSGKSPEDFEMLADYNEWSELIRQPDLPGGEYDVIIFYNDGSYFYHRQFPILNHFRTQLTFTENDLKPADVHAAKWAVMTSPGRNRHTKREIPYPSIIWPEIEFEHEENSVVYSISESENDRNTYDQPNYDTTQQTDPMATFYEEVKQLKTLRNNFSDVAFWQPALVTDTLGKARFRITFPDNLTRWDAVIYAMNEDARTGTARTSILSYKPIMAELSTPRFLVEGDHTNLIASIRNYTADREITGITVYDAPGDSIQTERIRFDHSFRTHYPLTALPVDTLSATFRFIRDDKYTDGEEKKIPLVAQGTEITEGYRQLLTDTSPLTITGTPDKTYTVQLTNRKLDLCVNAMQYLYRYEYACNEQLASRLKGMLGIRLMKQYMGEEFEYDTEVQDMISRLLKNQNPTGLWGWWNHSDETSHWMSAHILEALSMAQQAGYTFTFPRSFQLSEVQLYNMETIFSLPERWLNNRTVSLTKLEEELIEKEKKNPESSYLKEWLLIWEQRQKEGEKGIPELLLPYLRTHLDGTVSCQHPERKRWYWTEDPLMTTLIAYRIIRNTPEYAHYIEPMRAFTFQSQSASWNTYQSAQVVTTLLPELMKESGEANTSEVIISGKEEKMITRFPYEITLAEDEEIRLQKQGTTPVFCSVYSTQHTTTAHTNDHFTLHTYFEKGDTLEAGKVAKLLVEIEVKTPGCEYLMVNVPIPAGCSYAPSSSYGYTHREEFKERTTLFFEKLPEGKHQFEISLLPHFTGTYHLNPAKAELMYLPHIHCTNEMRKVIIEE